MHSVLLKTVRTSWAAQTCLGRACCSVLPPKAAVYKWAKIYSKADRLLYRAICLFWVLETGLLVGDALSRETMDQGMRLEHGGRVTSSLSGPGTPSLLIHVR